MLHKSHHLVVTGLTFLMIATLFPGSGCRKKASESAESAAFAEGVSVPVVLDPVQEEFVEAIKALQAGQPHADNPYGVGSLEFIRKNIGDEDVKKLAVLQDGQLQHLGLAHTEVTNASIPIIAKIPGLINLDLAQARLDNQGLKPLANHPTLRRLVINETAITDAGLEIVATIPNLECLEVYRCFITDEGLKHVGKMKNLVKISLDSTSVTDKGLEHLYPLTKLQRLQIWDTKVTQEGKRKFLETRPDVSMNDP